MKASRPVVATCPTQKRSDHFTTGRAGLSVNAISHPSPCSDDDAIFDLRPSRDAMNRDAMNSLRSRDVPDTTLRADSSPHPRA